MAKRELMEIKKTLEIGAKAYGDLVTLLTFHRASKKVISKPDAYGKLLAEMAKTIPLDGKDFLEWKDKYHSKRLKLGTKHYDYDYTYLDTALSEGNDLIARLGGKTIPEKKIRAASSVYSLIGDYAMANS